MIRVILLITALMLCVSAKSIAQTAQEFPPVKESEIRRITAVKATEKIAIDGRLDEAAWKTVQPSPDFVDLISGKPTAYKTNVKVIWDDVNLYVGYDIEEPQVVAKFKTEDDPIYQDNDVEFFIAGDDAYYEFEINAFGTVYDGLFVWQDVYESSGIAKIAEFDRTDKKVQSQSFNGVGLTTHPRGLRWAFLDWDFKQVQSAVHIDGTINDNSDQDRGWSVEIAVPWKNLNMLNMSKPRSLPPKSGDVWRMDFSRFNQYRKPDAEQDSGGWALSYHGVWDSHVPECFPFVTFSTKPTAK
jgi:Carbohydrate-binding family 9